MKNLIRVYETLPLLSNKYTQFVQIADFAGSQPDGYVLRWPFFVQGSGNAHMLVSPVMNPTELDDVYEIVIGASGNQEIIIRKRMNGAVLAEVHVPNVLSVLKLKKFFLDITKGTILLVIFDNRNYNVFSLSLSLSIRRLDSIVQRR